MVLIRKIVRAKKPVKLDEPFRKSSLTQDERLEVLLLPFQFLHLCKTFVLVARPFCILSLKKNERIQMLICRLRFTITKCTSNEWC